MPVDYIPLKATYRVRACPARHLHRFAVALPVLQVHTRIDEQRNRLDTSKVTQAGKIRALSDQIGLRVNR